MKKIRVLEVINEPTMGGGQSHLLLLTKGLDKKRFQVIVASSSNGPFIEELNKNGIRHISVKMRGKLNFQAVFSTARLVRKEKIDILHTHGGVAGLSARIGALIGRSPIIIHTLHGIHYLNYKNRFLKWLFIYLERFFSLFTEAIILVSDSDKEKGVINKLAKKEKMRVIKNGIEFSEFQKKIDVLAKKKALGIDPSWPLIGTVARLHRQKGHIYLLKAAKKVIKALPQTRFLIIGDGPLRKDLEKYQKELRLEKNVIFLGARRDIPELLLIIDLFALPSLWEGLPLTLLEAVASSKPVVATDVDGNREIIEDERTGILVPPRNPEWFANAIIKFLKDKDYCYQLAQEGKKSVINKFSASKMVEQTEKLYLELYEKKFFWG